MKNVIDRTLLLAISLVGLTSSACSSSPAAPTEAREPAVAPRILVEAVLYDAPRDAQVPPLHANLAALPDVASKAGARNVVGAHALVANDEAASMLMTTDAGAAANAFSGGRLLVRPHLAEAGQIRLEVDLQLGDKSAKTTLVVNDRQAIVLGPQIDLEQDRRLVIVLRPWVVRGEADLRAKLDEIGAARAAGTSAGPH